MVARDDLIQALNDGIDRLNAGEELEAILADYPAFASQLRPMLEAGLLLPRVVHIPAAEVEAWAAAGEPVIRETVRQVFRGGVDMVRWIVLLLLLGLGLLVGVMLLRNADGVGVQVTETVIPTVTITATLPPTLIPTAENVIAPPPEMTATPVPQPDDSSDDSDGDSDEHSVDDDNRVIVVEGPVEAIDDDSIRIFDLIIRIDDPRLRVIKLGDIIRIEGRFDDDDGIRAIVLIFRDVIVLVHDGEVWRGDDCAVPPPVWAEDAAGDWYNACRPVQPPPGPGQGNESSGSDSFSASDS